MDFAFSEEQDEFRETLRRFFEQKSASSDVRHWMETPGGFDEALWKQMGEELGLQGIHIPEAYGGQGFGMLELGIAFEEMGRCLLCAPYFSTVALAANAVLNAGSEAQKQALLPGIAAGDTIASLALLEDSDRWDAHGVELVAEPDGDAFRLTGQKRLVGDAQVAGAVVVAARLAGTQGDDGITLLWLPCDAAGIEVTPLEPMDLTRKLADLRLDGARAEALGEPGAAGPALARTLHQAGALLASESAGGAERCLEAAVAYAKVRVQFGRPIGSYQAIKHMCADLLLEVESARVAARWAGWVAEENPDELALASRVAKALCCDTFVLASRESIQIHGGIGFTWEADPQLYFKRAKTNESLLGTPRFHRARLAESFGI